MNNEIEMRALETQDDYQREYDSLFKQLSRTNLLIIKFKDQQIEAVNAAKKTWDKKIDSAYEEFYEIEDDIKKLLTDAKSKGFNIKKRSEETEDIEMRKYDSADKYTAAINKIRDKVNDLYKEADKLHKSTESKLDDIAKEADKLLNDQAQLIVDATQDGFGKGLKYKDLSDRPKCIRFRSEETDFESRKQTLINDLSGFEERKTDILLNLEERAKYKSENDCQDEINKYVDRYNDFKKRYDVYKEQLIDAQKEVASLELTIEEYERSMKKMKDNATIAYKNGSKQGFKNLTLGITD